jgi:hypothetical protein
MAQLPTKSRHATSAAPLTTRQVNALLLCGAICWLPLLPHLPGWLALLTALPQLWRALLQHPGSARSSMPGPAKLPPRWLLTLLALSGTAAIGMHFQSLFGRSPGVALLTLLFSLKLLETHSRRDAFAFVLLAGFVLISQFLYAQNLLGAVLMLLGSALIVSALALLERPDQTWPAVLRLSGQLLLQATPFMVLLFLLFPRIQTPLWGLPADAFSRTTGLSDEMSPGSISLLSQSDNIAFRASFSGGQNGATPHQTQLYWRGWYCTPSMAAPGASARHPPCWNGCPQHPRDPPSNTPSPWNRITKIGCSPWNAPPACPTMHASAPMAA